MSEAERIAQELTWAQRQLVLREAGRYQDDTRDVAALMNLEIWGTTLTPLGLEVRNVLLSSLKGEGNG